MNGRCDASLVGRKRGGKEVGKSDGERMWKENGNSTEGLDGVAEQRVLFMSDIAD